MNETITKLALDVSVINYVDNETPRHYFVPAWVELDDIEKFAKLIASECANVCDRFQERDVGMQPAECAGAIRKMFGIE